MQPGALSSFLDRIIRIVTGTLMVFLVAIMVAQVFFRYVLNSSLTWSEEVAVYLMIWVVFLGSAILVRWWEHVQIPTLVEACPRPLRIVLILLSRLASMVCMAVFIWYGTEAFLGNYHAASFTTGISTRWIKLSIPVGAGFMVLYALIVLAEDIRALRSGNLARFDKVSPPAPGRLQSGDP